MLGTMIIAWILTWFGLDNLFITGINELFHTNFTLAIYWVIALLIGAIIYITREIKN